jgi:hypothetical protein
MERKKKGSFFSKISTRQRTNDLIKGDLHLWCCRIPRESSPCSLVAESRRIHRRTNYNGWGEWKEGTWGQSMNTFRKASSEGKLVEESVTADALRRGRRFHKVLAWVCCQAREGSWWTEEGEKWLTSDTLQDTFISYISSGQERSHFHLTHEKADTQRGSNFLWSCWPVLWKIIKHNFHFWFVIRIKFVFIIKHRLVPFPIRPELSNSPPVFNMWVADTALRF